MVTWNEHLQSVHSCLRSISHLLKGEHSDEEAFGYSSETESEHEADANGNSLPNTLQDVNETLGKWLSGDDHAKKQSERAEPTASMDNGVDNFNEDNSSNENGGLGKAMGDWYFFDNSPISNTFSDALMVMNASFDHQKCNDATSATLSWVSEAMRGESNIAVLGSPNQPMGTTAAVGEVKKSCIGISPRRLFLPPQYPEQPQPNDPTLFHLNSFDSPPPSPQHELEDYEFNMRDDPNGVIPAGISFQILDIFQESNSMETNNAVCHLELCPSFDYLIKTTAENVADKQNVLKEMLNHAKTIMSQAAECCPIDKRIELAEISASIVLIHNSLGQFTDLESYMKSRQITFHLVQKVRTALERYI